MASPVFGGEMILEKWVGGNGLGRILSEVFWCFAGVARSSGVLLLLNCCRKLFAVEK